jgi:hypothetical protein
MAIFKDTIMVKDRPHDRAVRAKTNAMMKATLLVICLCAGLGVSAQAKVIKWNCTFPTIASPKGIKPQEDFKLLFAFDDLTGKATLIGNNGVSDVFVRQGDRNITILEPLVFGPMQMTTITDAGHSVHSRHTFDLVDGTLFPSQSYGSCTKE